MMKLRIFFWFHHKSGQSFGVISIYFRVFLRSRYIIGLFFFFFFFFGGGGGAYFQINSGYA